MEQLGSLTETWRVPEWLTLAVVGRWNALGTDPSYSLLSFVPVTGFSREPVRAVWAETLFYT